MTCLRVSSYAISLLLAIGTNASCSSSGSVARQEAFESFVVEYDRDYARGSQEWDERRELFEASLAKVEAHNCRTDKSWHAVINKHSDRRPLELQSLLGWKRTGPIEVSNGNLQLIEDVDIDGDIEDGLPKTVDYKDLPAMQDILDQGMCGSCWAFASSVVLRANYYLWQGSDRTFSPQEIVSCTKNPRECGGSGGCDGATAELAMDYVMQSGCRTEEEMHYEASDVACPGPSGSLSQGGDGGSQGLNMVGWKTLPSNKAIPLMQALANQGPVAVSVAVFDNWFMYGGGVMSDCDHSDPIVNHAVVLIGYGAAGDGMPFWEIQNSWGPNWGDAGFLKLKRDHNEEKDYCGWDTKPQDGVACKDDKDPKVYVCGMCGILYDSVVPYFAKGKNASKSLLATNGFLRSVKKH